ncbi:daptide-type RiPP [Parafrankia discariae]|uniref:daptide-type RiPP n=1 Tax=Parafrankia discariae TaxID=365528 RepID=UPI0012B6A727|nr:daptide-type RiPP [Parafrankia discariae]
MLASVLVGHETDTPALSLGVEELEPLEAPFDWAGFWQGFRVGVAVAGAAGAGIGIGIAIT